MFSISNVISYTKAKQHSSWSF